MYEKKFKRKTKNISTFRQYQLYYGFQKMSTFSIFEFAPWSANVPGVVNARADSSEVINVFKNIKSLSLINFENLKSDNYS